MHLNFLAMLSVCWLFVYCNTGTVPLFVLHLLNVLVLKKYTGNPLLVNNTEK